ncbi:TetR family transcriptional regulator [Rhodococcus hoagii]|nr:TetR family transcriptional regulator [Prescottella equi]
MVWPNGDATPCAWTLRRPPRNCFIADGFDATSVEDIAQGAGISVRTFYRHCEAKEDTLTAVLTSGIRDFAENLAARPSTDSVATAVHEAFVECVRQDRTPPSSPRATSSSS